MPDKGAHNGATEALVFDIKRYAINDGPGIRVTIFLKGCPLACRWCHNPEGIAPQVQKMYSANRCIGCQECVKACPLQACELTPDGIVTDLSVCDACGECAAVCPAKATEMSGRYVSMEDLLRVIEAERPFFEESGGGVTFSGGEPLLYPKFLIEMLDTCGRMGIHRTVDTSGLAARHVLLDVARRTDLFLYDLKLMDTARHREWTGAGNRKILDNLKALAEAGAQVQIRIPLIGGVNTDAENIEATAAFVAALPGAPRPVNLLPYHDIARGKAERLGQTYDPGPMSEPSEADIERIVACFTRQGLQATVGG